MMAATSIPTTAFMNASIRSAQREPGMLRRLRMAAGGSPAATYSDRTRDPVEAAQIYAERVLTETWGWS
jgi:hypothetical protein